VGCDTFTISVPECSVSPVLSLVLPPLSSPQVGLAGEDEEAAWCKCVKENIGLRKVEAAQDSEFLRGEESEGGVKKVG